MVYELGWGPQVQLRGTTCLARNEEGLHRGVAGLGTVCLTNEPVELASLRNPPGPQGLPSSPAPEPWGSVLSSLEPQSRPRKGTFSAETG